MSRNHRALGTYISPSGWYALSYPESWEFEVDDDCTSFYKRHDGVGVLQISAYETNAPQSAKDNLVEYLNDEGVTGEITTLSSANDQTVAVAEFEKGDSYIKVWFAVRGSYLLFITYICDLSVKNVEDEDINMILGSLQLTE